MADISRGTGDGDVRKSPNLGAVTPPVVNSGAVKKNVVELSAGDYPGRFQRLAKILGKGANKDVYLAHDTLTGQDVAWNRVARLQLSDKEQEVLRKEIEMMNKADHAHIIKYLAMWDTDNFFIFITHFFNMSLKSFIADREVTLNSVKKWTRQILEGLEHLHAHDVMHRDVKCENIFINQKTSDIVIGDLGLSRIAHTNNHRSMSMVGTVPYMAPEQLDLEERQYDSKVDIYALGMTVLEMISGNYPYQECATLPLVIRMKLDGKTPKLLDLLEEGQTKDFIQLCLTVDPAQRPTATQLLQEDWLNESEETIIASSLISPDTSMQSQGDQNTTAHDPEHSSLSEIFGATRRQSMMNVVADGMDRLLDNGHDTPPRNNLIGDPTKRRSLRANSIASTLKSPHSPPGRAGLSPTYVQGPPDLNISDTIPANISSQEEELQGQAGDNTGNETPEVKQRDRFQEFVADLVNTITNTETPQGDNLEGEIWEHMSEIDSSLNSFKEEILAVRTTVEFENIGSPLLVLWDKKRQFFIGWEQQSQINLAEKQERIKQVSSEKENQTQQQSQNEDQTKLLRQQLQEIDNSWEELRNKKLQIEAQIKELQAQVAEITLEMTKTNEQSTQLETELNNTIEQKKIISENLSKTVSELDELTHNVQLIQGEKKQAEFNAWRSYNQGIMDKVQQTSELRWKEWTPEEIVNWMCRLDEGVFRDRKQILIEKLPDLVASGEELSYLDKDTLREVGIVNIKQRVRLLQHINRLKHNNPSQFHEDLNDPSKNIAKPTV